MNTRDCLLAHLRRGPATGSELARREGITRQAVNLHLQRLVAAGLVERNGRTRGTVFRLTPTRPSRSPPALRRIVRLPGLEEDRVYEEASQALGLRRALRPNVERIAAYAFTEILNNAIDHSRSPRARIEAQVDAYGFRFLIRDQGVGVFERIRAQQDLPDEEAAVRVLLQGRVTTLPERHSGEGLFFTSRVADRFRLRSHRWELLFDNLRDDRILSHRPACKGTEVEFVIRRQCRRTLEEVFRRHAPEEFDYRFERTQVYVDLHREALTSRSEAKRMLAGLERFREVWLECGRVQHLGQAFADETFRVFPSAHPGTRLVVRGLPAALRPMVDHVLDNRKPENLTID